ncbi:MAG: FHA domain-containing protein [Anaerolineaceae bacterium]|nr:FHA domain-containing protein [Anaerolineaceae bacterium]
MYSDEARLIATEREGQEYLIDRTPFLIGRKSNANLFISSATVSREHAVIEQINGEYYIRDAGSTNGTWLNRKRIGSDPVKLQDDDVISVSRGYEYVFIMPGRTMPMIDDLYAYGLEIDAMAYQIYVDGVEISPDKRGYQLLSLLAEQPGKIYTYQEIAQRIYPDDYDPESQRKRIQAAKNDLSKRLKSLGIGRSLIKSKNGVGYQLSRD